MLEAALGVLHLKRVFSLNITARHSQFENTTLFPTEFCLGVFRRSVRAQPQDPARGSRGGSAVSPSAHPDQAVSHKALLHVAAQRLVAVHCGGRTSTSYKRNGSIWDIFSHVNSA